MAKNDVGIHQSVDKMWYYRLKVVLPNGSKKDVKITGFRTKTEARDARAAKMVELKNPVGESEQNLKISLSEAFEHYLKNEGISKRPATIKKHKSLWNNHIAPKFGDRCICTITVGELHNFLVSLYYRGDDFNNYSNSYAFGYVESFLKFFYLIFGYAERNGFITKNVVEGALKMPKKNKEEDEKIEIYSEEEIEKIKLRLTGCNCYTAFMLGYYLGVRIGECFALQWSNINWTTHEITIDKQQVYEDYFRCLVPVKTVKSKRIIAIPDVLYFHLKEYKMQQEYNMAQMGTAAYRNKEEIRIRIKKEQDDSLTGGDFINRKETGELMTTDSLKYWAKIILSELGIHFKYHNLRHTHASYLAALNVPAKALMQRLGHKKISTTYEYYIATNSISNDKLIKAINQI